jgi:hypothetical protein
MATTKKLNSTYTIDTADVVITGNLTVNGAQTAIETTNTKLKDNIIVLNDGETGAGVTLNTSGILINRGTSLGVSLLWNEGTQKWQVTQDGTTYVNVVSSTTGVTTVFDDKNPKLGGNLNTNGYSLYSGTGNNIFSGNIQVTNTAGTPGAVSGATVLYAATPGGGTAGVYVVNSSAVNQELITKTRSLGLSLLL